MAPLDVRLSQLPSHISIGTPCLCAACTNSKSIGSLIVVGQTRRRGLREYTRSDATLLGRSLPCHRAASLSESDTTSAAYHRAVAIRDVTDAPVRRANLYRYSACDLRWTIDAVRRWFRSARRRASGRRSSIENVCTSWPRASISRRSALCPTTVTDIPRSTSLASRPLAT